MFKIFLKRLRFQRKVQRLANHRWILSLSVLTFLGAVLTGSRNGYFLWLFMLSVRGGSFWYVNHNAKNLNYYFYIRNQERTTGDMISFSYDLVNNSVFPMAFAAVKMDFSKEFSEMESDEECFYFRGNQMFNRTFKTRCVKRGHYQIGRMTARVQDPLGLFEIEKVFDKTIDVLIYPKIWPLTKLGILPSELYGRRAMYSPVYEDYTNIKELRDYRSGDNFKHVHWKLSAKTEQLRVKQYELNAKLRIHLVIDGSKGAYLKDGDGRVEETAASAAATILNYALKDGSETSLSSNAMIAGSRSQRTGKSHAMLHRFLMDLVHFEPHSTIKLEKYIAGESRKWIHGSNVILITPDPNYELIDFLSQLGKRRIHWLIINISTENTTSELGAYSQLKQIPILSLGPDSIAGIQEVIG